MGRPSFRRGFAAGLWMFNYVAALPFCAIGTAAFLWPSKATSYAAGGFVACWLLHCRSCWPTIRRRAFFLTDGGKR